MNRSVHRFNDVLGFRFSLRNHLNLIDDLFYHISNPHQLFSPVTVSRFNKQPTVYFGPWLNEMPWGWFTYITRWYQAWNNECLASLILGQIDFFDNMTQCHEADSFWNNHVICALSTEFEICNDRHGPSLRRWNSFNCLTLGFLDIGRPALFSKRRVMIILQFPLSWWRHRINTYSVAGPLYGKLTGHRWQV